MGHRRRSGFKSGTVPVRPGTAEPGTLRDPAQASGREYGMESPPPQGTFRRLCLGASKR